jgi:hypothetical protein
VFGKISSLSVEKYIICFFYTTYTVTLFASNVEEKSQVEVNSCSHHISICSLNFCHQMTVGVIFTVIGFIVHIWLVAAAYMYLRTTCGTSVRFHEIRCQMRKFMGFKRLPTTVQQRILSFYDFSFNGNHYRVHDINVVLGKEQLQSVTAETYSRLLRVNYFFQQFPDEILNSIANCMTRTVYLANDVVCKVNSAQRAQVCFLLFLIKFPELF